MKRNLTLTVKVSDMEFRALSSIAQNNGVNISEATRMLIHERCQREGFSVGMVAAPETQKHEEQK